MEYFLQGQARDLEVSRSLQTVKLDSPSRSRSESGKTQAYDRAKDLRSCGLGREAGKSEWHGGKREVVSAATSVLLSDAISRTIPDDSHSISKSPQDRRNRP